MKKEEAKEAKKRVCKRYTTSESKTEKNSWNSVAQHYSRNVELKGSGGDRVRRAVLYPDLLRLIWDTKGKKVLDIGCGDGCLSDELDGAIFFGCDISDKFIELAKTKHPNGNFQVNIVGERLPYENNFFDIVVSSLVLQSASDYKGLINESYRVLKPRGKAVIAIMHPYHYKMDNTPFKEGRQDVFVDGAGPIPYFRRRPSKYKSCFENAGYKIVEICEPLLKPEQVTHKELEKYSHKPYFIIFVLQK